MSPIAQLIANLPEEQLIKIIERECVGEIAILINSKDSLKNKLKELDKLRTSELVLVLPATEQKNMLATFDTAAMAFKEMAAIRK